MAADPRADPERRITAERAVTLTWIGLSAITIGSWWLAPGEATETMPSVPLSLAVIVLGFVKCRLIIRWFMEVRAAPRRLVAYTDAWLTALWTSVLVLYLLAA